MARRLRTGCAATLLLLLLLALPAAARAQYTYTTNNGTITITGYTGSGGAVIIPSTINGLPVTSMGFRAFYSCAILTSVTIGTNVTSIGADTFESCFGLTNVTIPNSVTSIGFGAFYTCTSLTSVTIPNSVTNIGGYAFACCTNLTAITVDTNNPVYSSVDGVLLNKSQTTLFQYPAGKAGNYTIPSSVTNIGTAVSLSSAAFHRQANRKIPMGVAWVGYGRDYFNYSVGIAAAGFLKANGLIAHGYDTVLMNCGTLSPNRDVNGNLQIGQPTPINVTNFVADLLTNGCYFGFHFYAQIPDNSIDECNSMMTGPTNAYRDGYTIGSWGVRQVWNGGSGFFPEADFRFISEAFHAGLYDGAIAGGWPYVPNSMISSGEGRNYRWVPEVWNLPYVRASNGPDMLTVPVTAWQEAFFFSMRNYNWMFTEGSSPSLEGFVTHDTFGSDTAWVTTNALRFIFGMECLNSMPLYIGGPNLQPGEAGIITNDLAIAIDQDQLRAPPFIVSSNASSAVVAKQLLNGDVALALWNLSTNSDTTISVNLSDVPGVHSNIVSVVDIFDGVIIGATNSLQVVVNRSGLNLYRVLLNNVDVHSSMVITTSKLPNALKGANYDQTIAVTGGLLPYTWSVSTGQLPAGLSLDSATGEITGSPSWPSGMSAEFTIRVTDAGTPALPVQKQFVIFVLDPTTNTEIQGALQQAGTSYQLGLIWSSATGLSYQIQSATNLSAASWQNEGASFSGTGNVMSTNIPIVPGPKKFFRLLLL